MRDASVPKMYGGMGDNDPPHITDSQRLYDLQIRILLYYKSM